MNICFFGNFTSGGTERAAFLVANGLQEHHDVNIINSCKQKPTFYLSPEIEMSYLPNGNIARRILSLAKCLKKRKIDVLITVEAMTGILSVPAAFLAQCKHIVWDHANYYQHQGCKYIQRVRQIELNTANAYVVLTRRDFSNFQNHFKCKVPLEHIYNIAEPQKNNRYNLKSKTIISAGHIRKIKNFIAIPEIGKIIFPKYPDWCWKIYGDARDEEYEKIQKKIIEYRLENNIVFCGRSNDMETEYQNAAIYVMTSLQEGLPMVLLEAKSNKLPLVSFDIETGPDEIIQDGINGYLVPAYDVQIMAEKICFLIENKDLRMKFSYQTKLDLEKFDSETIIEKWNELIKLVTMPNRKCGRKRSNDELIH
jgi:glycosyltransferase involved in cell wall biosynthesis